MKNLGITVYGCDSGEKEAFNALSPRFGITPKTTSFAVSEKNAKLSFGSRCISVGHKSEVSKSTLFALKESGVQYISTRSIGFNHIDVETAESIGITVGNVAYSPDSVADFTLMLMLMAIRNMKTIVRAAKKYDFRGNPMRGKELRDMTVGVLGAGQIGKAVIERLRGFGCQTLVCGHKEDPKTASISLSELLRESDIITIHVPLNSHTYHMIGREQIAAMKPGAILINTARGGLVDTDALIGALEEGKLGGAALDVLEGEEGLFYFDCTQKPVENEYLLKLQEMPNVIITPHTAYYTERALNDMTLNTILNCLDFERSRLYG